ncbi:DUF2235 domain-containing protein [Aestuariibius insulae]|uniref:DUF2235 domain-containing protein n=1 Tax=Aestuariibius insulae TaxID=2058287 RepID=UPI00345E7174
MRLRDWLLGLIGRAPKREGGQLTAVRGRHSHVIILDGTMSSLDDGHETNAGLLYKLLSEQGPRLGLTVYYEAGIQWRDWSRTWDVIAGRGINRQIQRAYGVLASRYRPGDLIFLVGFSRGAYAVRSLAGVIDRIGLLRAEDATERNIREVYRHYQASPDSEAAAVFAARHCHETVEIEAVALWDTVKALGLRVPLLWRFLPEKHAFHNHALGPAIRHGFHALALEERRMAYAPVMWVCNPDWPGQMEQVWFRGTHGDVGGQLGGFLEARPLANIPLVWIISRLEMCGLELPDGWRSRYEQDAGAPSIGAWRGWSKLFLWRRRRVVGRDPSERLHEAVQQAPEIGLVLAD